MSKYLRARLRKYIFIILTTTLFSLITFSKSLSVENIFIIDNVKVEGAIDINFSRDKYINKAFLNSFEILMSKILLLKDLNKIDNIKLKKVKGLISSFQILEESYRNNEYKASKEEIVEIDLLDNFCKDFSLNNEFIVKIDSQGNELEVIQGGVETLRRSSVVLLECSFAPQYLDKEHTFSECFAILKNLDLHPIIFQKYGLAISSYGVERDVIFVKKELLSKVYYKNY